MTVREMGQTLCLFIYDIVGVSAPTNQGARGEYVFCAPARFVSASGPLLCHSVKPFPKYCNKFNNLIRVAVNQMNMVGKICSIR